MFMGKFCFRKKISGVLAVFSVAVFAVGLLTAQIALGEDVFAPTVESAFLNSSPFVNVDGYENGTIGDLVAASTSSLYINGLVQDLDGSASILSVSAVFYRSGAQDGSNCLADNNFCYRVAACDTQANEDPNQLLFSCPISLWYYADSTVTGGRYENDNWRVSVKASDSLADGFNDSLYKEMPKLLALNIPSEIDFGIMNLGSVSTSENNVAMAISQDGNVVADVEVSGSSLSCSVNGEIPLENQSWALNDVGFANGVVLTALAVDTNLNVSYQDDDFSIPTQNLYWNLSIPESGLGGMCTGVTTVTAIAH